MCITPAIFYELGTVISLFQNEFRKVTWVLSERPNVIL